MELKLYLEGNECDEILRSNGYIVEEVDGWYENDPYIANDYVDTTMSCMKVKVAYLPCDRDKIKKSEHPTVNELKEYKYDKIVSNIIKKAILTISNNLSHNNLSDDVSE